MNEVIVIECKKNIKLRSGSGNARVHNNFLTNAYFNAYAIADSCTDCY